MSTRTLALHNYVSHDGFVFTDGPMAQRQALKHVHASWAKHLEQFGNADAMVEKLFQVMHDCRDKYTGNPQDFWESVKDQLSWTLFLSITDVSDIAEGMVQARRNYIYKMEDEGLQVNDSSKTLPNLVHRWLEWHDEIRQVSRSVSVALSFAPDNYAPSGRMYILPTREPSSDEDDGFDDERPLRTTMGPPATPTTEHHDMAASAAVDSMTEPRNEASDSPKRRPRPRSYIVAPTKESLYGFMESIKSVSETGPPLPSSLRLAKIITQTPADIMRSIPSPTDPGTYDYTIAYRSGPPAYATSTNMPRTMPGLASGPVFKRTIPPSSAQFQAFPGRVQKATAPPRLSKAVQRNSTNLQALVQAKVDSPANSTATPKPQSRGSPTPSASAEEKPRG